MTDVDDAEERVIQSAITLLRINGYTVLPPFEDGELACPACGADFARVQAEAEKKPAASQAEAGHRLWQCEKGLHSRRWRLGEQCSYCGEPPTRAEGYTFQVVSTAADTPEQTCSRIHSMLVAAERRRS